MANLIIGVGGTGIKVIRALREHIFRLGDADNNKYLSLDTMAYDWIIDEAYSDDFSQRIAVMDNVDMTQKQGARTYDQLVNKKVLELPKALLETEYFKMAGLTPNEYERYKISPDECFSWLDINSLVNNHGARESMFAFKIGAGQLRQVGRIGTVKNAGSLARTLTDRARGERIQSVYIICSLAGGTGSGNFIDVAIIARNALKAQGAGELDINGVILLPKAFAAEAAERDAASIASYASILELSRFQSKQFPQIPLSVKYPNSPEPVTVGKLFESIALIEMDALGELESGDEGNRRKTIYPQMAEMINLLASGNISGVEVNAAAQVAAKRNAANENRQTTATIRQIHRDSLIPQHFYKFKSFRVIIPQKIYKLKAAAQEIEALAKYLANGEPALKNDVHIHDEMAENFRGFWASLKNLLFGQETELRSYRDDNSVNENAPSVTANFLREPDNSESFTGKSGSSFYAVLGINTAGVAYPGADDLAPLLNDNNTSIPGAVEDNLRKINWRLESDFGLENLDALSALDIEKVLDLDAQYPIAFRRAIEDHKNGLKQHYRTLIKGNLEANVFGGLRKIKYILEGLDHHFIEPIEAKVHEKNNDFRNKFWATLDRARVARDSYRTACKERKPLFRAHPCVAAWKEYAENAHECTLALLNWLSSTVLLKEINNMRQLNSNWLNCANQTIKDLVGLTNKDSNDKNKAAIANESFVAWSHDAIKETSDQLDSWRGSHSISLGLPANVIDANMEMVIEEEMRAQAKGEANIRKENFTWSVPDDEIALNLSAEESVPISFDKKGFLALHKWFGEKFKTSYEAWNIAKYFDRVLPEDGAAIGEAARRFAGLLDRKLGISDAVSDVNLVNGNYIICHNITHGFIRNLGEQIQQATNAATPGVKANSNRYELNIVSTQAGHLEENYQELVAGKNLYQERILNRATNCRINHIFSEEENMFWYEVERAAGPNAILRENLILPPRLAYIFRKPQWAKLFLKMHIAGLIVFHEATDGDQNDRFAYWCLRDMPAIKKALNGENKLAKMAELTKTLREGIAIRQSNVYRISPVHIPQENEQDPTGVDFFTSMLCFANQIGSAENVRFCFNDANLKELDDLLLWYFITEQDNGRRLFEDKFDEVIGAFDLYDGCGDEIYDRARPWRKRVAHLSQEELPAFKEIVLSWLHSIRNSCAEN